MIKSEERCIPSLPQPSTVISPGRWTPAPEQPLPAGPEQGILQETGAGLFKKWQGNLFNLLCLFSNPLFSHSLSNYLLLDHFSQKSLQTVSGLFFSANTLLLANFIKRSMCLLSEFFSCPLAVMSWLKTLGFLFWACIMCNWLIFLSQIVTMTSCSFLANALF